MFFVKTFKTQIKMVLEEQEDDPSYNSPLSFACRGFNIS